MWAGSSAVFSFTKGFPIASKLEDNLEGVFAVRQAGDNYKSANIAALDQLLLSCRLQLDQVSGSACRGSVCVGKVKVTEVWCNTHHKYICTVFLCRGIFSVQC